ATGNFDVDGVDVAAQISPARIHNRVGNLARIVEIVGTQYAQGTLKVLLPRNRPTSALFDNHAQLADGIVGCRTSGHCARSAIMTSLRIQFRIASSPSSVLRLVKENGLSPRNSRESFSMTDRSAPT